MSVAVSTDGVESVKQAADNEFGTSSASRREDVTEEELAVCPLTSSYTCHANTSSV